MNSRRDEDEGFSEVKRKQPDEIDNLQLSIKQIHFLISESVIKKVPHKTSAVWGRQGTAVEVSAMRGGPDGKILIKATTVCITDYIALSRIII